MGFRVEYKSFNFDKYELTEARYYGLITKLRLGKALMDDAIPKISFFKAERTRINRVLIIVSVATSILLYGLLIGDVKGVFPLFYMTIMLAIALGGAGVVFSLISYLSYTSKREAYLFKMKRDLIKSTDYEDYCKIRNIEYPEESKKMDAAVSVLADILKKNRS